MNWQNPYLSTRTPIMARNVVATSQPLAAQAGLQLLWRGGNAVDAAIAAAATIALTEPCSNGLGSDNFALVWDGKALHGLNSSGPAPAAWNLAYFQNKYGADLAKNRPTRGVDTVTVPGAVAGWAALHERFGRASFEDVLAPAIGYAERGFAVSPNVAEKWGMAAPILQGFKGFAEVFLPFGRAPAPGEHFCLKGAAAALKAIAQSKGRAFYEGPIAAAIVSHMRADGGVMTEADLASFRPEWVEPISMNFAGHDLHEIPPNGQGIAALMALGILKHTGLPDYKVDSPDWHHVSIEAMKLAFADVYAYVSDARSMRVPVEALLSDAYLAERAKRIDMKRAQAFSAGAPAKGGTIYLSAADESGMMVSFIQSNYMGFGSGVVVPEFGVSLQNRGHGFAFDPSHANVVESAKRPFHTIIPAFLTRGDEAVMSFGVMGGNMQPQGHIQTLSRMLLAAQQPQAACDAPRWKFMQGLDLEVEASMPLATMQALRERGHALTRADDSYMDFGSGQFIRKLPDAAAGYVAASDSRRDGQAVGF